MKPKNKIKDKFTTGIQCIHDLGLQESYNSSTANASTTPADTLSWPSLLAWVPVRVRRLILLRTYGCLPNRIIDCFKAFNLIWSVHRQDYF